MISTGRALLAFAAVLSLGCSTVTAWGGLFNRFNPSMLSNLGYGGHGGGYGRELFGASDTGYGQVTGVGGGAGNRISNLGKQLYGKFSS
jgi:hypothetical protein